MSHLRSLLLAQQVSKTWIYIAHHCRSSNVLTTQYVESTLLSDIMQQCAITRWKHDITWQQYDLCVRSM